MATGISPPPPLGRAAMPWDVSVADPVAAIGADREALGDTFAIDSGEQSYLFVFSPQGVQSFYAVTERDASKAIADWRMLRRKVPDELFQGRRTLPGELFNRKATTEYLDNARAAMQDQCRELGTSGEVELFALTRRLGHRLGLASWGPPGVMSGIFDDLVIALDELDGSDAFVTPRAVIGKGDDKATERNALAHAEGILAELVGAATDASTWSEAFTLIAERWSDESIEARAAGIARDVILIHLGSMSNLFAALGWTVVYLLQEPKTLKQVRAGDAGLTERCCLEAIRLAQRSIMLREVLQPIEFDAGDRVYSLQPGVTIATLLPLTNTTAQPGLEAFRADRWQRRRLGNTEGLAVPELVTTFGHGVHRCPAQNFALGAMSIAVQHLFEHYELKPQFGAALPLRGQIGGVGRSEQPCIVAYATRS